MWTDCPPGSYRARMMVDGQTYSSTFATEAEAAEWLVVTRGRVVAARAAQSLTVEDYACRWLGEIIGIAAPVVAGEQLLTTLRELVADVVDDGTMARSPVPASRYRAQQVGIY